MDNKSFITNSYLETQKIGEEIGQSVKNGKVFALHGDLGSGKTTFVQGLAKGLGIKRRIKSPTFIIVRTYDAGIMRFYHIDLYRVESLSDIKGLGIEEIINGSENIVAIEWPEKMKSLLPENKIDIFFENLGEDKRKIKIV